MFCKYCGIPLEDNPETCPNCGADLTAVAADEPVPEVTAEPMAEAAPEIVPEVIPAAAPAPAEPEVKVVYRIPPENEPLSAWSYFWLKVLFCVPIVGFIFLMIFTFHGGNLNRRSFARSYWCGLLVTLIIVSIFIILGIAFAGLFRSVPSHYYY